MGVFHVADTVKGVGCGDVAGFDWGVCAHEERGVVGFDNRRAKEDLFAFAGLRVDAVKSDISEKLAV